MTKDALKGSRERGRNRLDWRRGELNERTQRRGFKLLCWRRGREREGGKGGEGKGASGEEDIVSWVGRGAASKSGIGRVQRGGRSLWRHLEDAALPSMKVAERGPPGSLCGHRAAAPHALDKQTFSV